MIDLAGAPPRARLAVIGAGTAGLACAATLAAAGLRVQVFEKSRGLGGRIATRRPDGRDAPLGIDHGAPIAHAPDEETLAAMAEAFRVEPSPSASGPGLLGAPGMSDLVAPLADGLPIARGVEIAALARGAEDWLLRDKDGGLHGPFDAVVAAAPAPQTAALLGEACPSAETAAVYGPQVTALLAFDAPEGVATGLAAAPAMGPDGVIGRAIRNSDKPDRASGVETWVLHGTDAVSAAWIDREKDEIAADLWDAFRASLPAEVTPRYLAGHRWRYSEVITPVGRAYWLSDDKTLAACGDWRLGPTVGHAFKSGRMLGERLATLWAA